MNARSRRRRAQATLALTLALALSGCPTMPGLAPLSPDEAAETQAMQRLSQRGLSAPRCLGFDDGRTPTGLFVFALRASNPVAQATAPTVEERVVLQGVARLCIDNDTLSGDAVVCSLARTRLPEADGACSTLLPSVALLAAAPALTIQGSRAPNDPEGGFDATLTLDWGSVPGAALPAPWAGAGDAGPMDTPNEALDLDDDGAPGVTLRPDGDATRPVQAARRLTARMALAPISGGQLAGPAVVETDEVVLGGDAAAAFAGRSYAASTSADVAFVPLAPRVTGLTCGDATDAWAALPPLLADACR